MKQPALLKQLLGGNFKTYNFGGGNMEQEDGDDKKAQASERFFQKINEGDFDGALEEHVSKHDMKRAIMNSIMKLERNGASKLIEAYGGVDTRDDDGTTILMEAVIDNHELIVKELLNFYNADYSIKNSDDNSDDNKTAFEYAEEFSDSNEQAKQINMNIKNALYEKAFLDAFHLAKEQQEITIIISNLAKVLKTQTDTSGKITDEYNKATKKQNEVENKLNCIEKIPNLLGFHSGI